VSVLADKVDRSSSHWSGSIRKVQSPVCEPPKNGSWLVIYALIFAVIALVAAVFGFEIVPVHSPAIAKVVCFSAITLSVLCWGLAKFGEPTPYWAESGSGR
jgi:uncharacterized membrane protein YtjA (UPF0391 family)